MQYPYTDLRIGAPARLAILRRDFAQWYVKNPHAPRDRVTSWRDVRFANLRSTLGLGQGFNGAGAGRTPVWYTHSGAVFREWLACEVLGRDYTGWYTDPDSSGGLAQGIVARLPHGRFLAGYMLTDNDERVYFADIYDDKEDAARAGDEHARVIAEQEREYQERWRAAQHVSDNLKSARVRLAECRVLSKCNARYREEASHLLARIRELRAELRTDYADVEL